MNVMWHVVSQFMALLSHLTCDPIGGQIDDRDPNGSTDNFRNQNLSFGLKPLIQIKWPSTWHSVGTEMYVTVLYHH